MMIRSLALLAFLLAAPLSVKADQVSDNPRCPGLDQGQGCPGTGDPQDPGQQEPGKPGPGQQDDPGEPPVGGFCAGYYEGYYFNQPGIVSFQIQENEAGELHVTAWWRGGMWQGQGLCRQTSAWEAGIEIYFPGAPVHRGWVSTREQPGVAVMQGQIDHGYAFRLVRGPGNPGQGPLK